MIFVILFVFVVVVVFLCCYVVKLGKAKKNHGKTPKMEVCPGIFNMTSYVCMRKCVFSGHFCLVYQNTIKNILGGF